MSGGFYPIFISLFFVFAYLLSTGYKKGIRKASEDKNKQLWGAVFIISIPILLFVGGFLLLGFLLDASGISNPMQ